MKYVFFFILILSLFGCNSKDAELTPLQGSVDPALLPPYITNVSYPLPGVYIVPNTLNFTVTFSKPIEVLGVPSLKFFSDDSTYNANCLNAPGSVTTVLNFQYNVAGGEHDADGITIHPTLMLNGGSIYDNSTNEDATITFSPLVANGIKLDTTDPTILSITSNNGTYNIGDTIDFTVNYDYPVFITGVPRLRLGVDAGTEYAIYSSGSGTRSITYRYNTFDDGPFLEDYDGLSTYSPLLENGGTLLDAFGDPADLTFTDTPFVGVNPVDGKMPLETARSVATGDGDKAPGTPIDFTITYNETMIVDGVPRIKLKLDDGTFRYATYISGSGGGTLQFRYFVTAADIDLNGIEVIDAIDLNGGSILDRAGNAPSAVTQVFPASNITFNFTTVPTTLSRSSPATSTYKIGDVLEFSYTFSEPVTVSLGTPTLSLSIGGTSKNAIFFAGSNGTATLRFRYTIVEGDLDTDGLAIGSLNFNGASFKDASNNNASFSQSWPANTIRVDGVRPYIASFALPASGVRKPGDQIQMGITWSEQVSFPGAIPQIDFNVDSPATTRSFFSVAFDGFTQTYRYTAQANVVDLDGFAMPAALNPAGGTVVDNAGNLATNFNFPSAVDFSGITVVPTEMDEWYDVSKAGTYGASTTTLVEFKELIVGTRVPVVAGSPKPTLSGTPKRAIFNSTTQYIDLGTYPQLNYIILVMETNGSYPGTVFTSPTDARINISLGGLLTVGGACNNCADYYNGTTWNPTAIITGDFGTWSLNQKKIIVLDFKGISSVDLEISDDYRGNIHELMFLSGPAARTYIPNVVNVLKTKHSTTNVP